MNAYQADLKRSIQEQKDKITEAQIRHGELCRKCRETKHSWVKVHDAVMCEICGEHGGWWCPDSEDHHCNYEQADGTFDSDNCIHCGAPDERK
jgi:hypothetical protein